MKCLCRFGSLLACESFHADVHAGNLWLLRDGRIGFLDFGIIVLIALLIVVIVVGFFQCFSYLYNLRKYDLRFIFYLLCRKKDRVKISIFFFVSV